MSRARQLIESEAKPILYRDRVVKDGIEVCPHCQQEMHEKGTAYRDGKWFHGACGGEIIPRPMSTEERAWLEQFTR